MAGFWENLTARQGLASIVAGRTDSIDLARRTLEGIARADLNVGAFVCTLAQDALAGASITPGLLGGLPIAVKDIFDTCDLPTRYGSRLYADRPAQPADAAIVGAIKASGGLVIGKTTTTEFAFLEPTATRNPNAPGRTPGGSSAGSAASVAAGMVPWAIGTQTAGSIIRPASYCGTVGFKPSFGLLPTAGLKCFSWSLDTVGLFARNVADAAWLTQALSGWPMQIGERPSPIQRTIYIPEAYPWGELSQSATDAMNSGISAWRRAGATIRIVALPSFVARLFDIQPVIQGWEAWRALAGELDRGPHLVSNQLREYLQRSRQIDDFAYTSAQLTAREARARFADWLGPGGILMTPSAPDEAPRGLSSTGSSAFNRAWTLVGAPCLSVPGALGVHGFPIGLQLIGAADSDELLLQAGAALENELNYSMLLELA